MSACTRAFTVILLLLALVACSSPSTPPSTDGAATSAAPTDGSAEDGTADDGDTPTSLGADAGCDLLTTDEVNTALGKNATETEGDGSDGSFSCIYKTADGTPVLATAYATGTAVDLTWSSYADDESSEAMSGIGDEAIWFNGILMVRKGNSIVSLQATVADEEGMLRDSLPELGRIAADRM